MTLPKILKTYLPTPEVAAIKWEFRKEFLFQDASTNVFLAFSTTAWARIKLYDEIERLRRNVLYHDTDSIQAMARTILPWESFVDELDSDTITTFISDVSKKYVFKARSGETCYKVRDFTLNSKNVKKKIKV
ncbi:uncharacterized protein LOC129957511 [Argiope bruennichi]|uniref:uncharacterized protein LOC129957511 n=1 Tax=Argiope bruennichi TaxID=94029 RepID=UPI002494D554|nr:uncharacterized protein LOC129957511 [Argiope bruennichi]